MTEFLVCFNCCIGDQPQPWYLMKGALVLENLYPENLLDLYWTQIKRHRRLDRNMIGEPTNFVHITHVGTKGSASCFPIVGPVQEQMKSEEGYSNNYSTSVQI